MAVRPARAGRTSRASGGTGAAWRARRRRGSEPRLARRVRDARLTGRRPTALGRPWNTAATPGPERPGRRARQGRSARLAAPRRPRPPSARLRLLSSGQLVAPSSPGRRLRIPSSVSGEPSMSGMRVRGWRRQGGIMSVTLCVRPGDGGTIVAIGGEVDVCTEAPLQQSLLRIIRECGAKLMLDVSDVSFMDCAGPAGAPGDPAPRRAARRVRAPDRDLGGSPPDHRTDRNARGVGWPGPSWPSRAPSAVSW